MDKNLKKDLVEVLKKHGLKADGVKPTESEEEEVEIDTYSATSWTSDEAIAHDFSARGKGVVIKKK